MSPGRAGRERLTLVVDTSVVAKLFLNDENYVDLARGAFAAFERRAIHLVAPASIYYELPATLLKAVRLRRISESEARDALQAFLGLPIPVLGGEPASVRLITRSAYVLANDLGCSYYDATFLAMAQVIGSQVLSADDKARKNIGKKTNLFLWIEDFRLP